MENDQTEKEKKTIMQLYAAFVASMALSFAPSVMLALFGLALLLAVIISAYVYKYKGNGDSLLSNHMTYLIGTIWIGSFLLLVGLIAAGAWVYQVGDHSQITNLIDNVMSGIVPSEDQIISVAYEYIQENMGIMILSGIVCVGPALAYLVYRTVNGLSRAMKGYRMAHPRSWV